MGPGVTLDVDAHLVESRKRTALPTYEGYRGYQPLLAQWAETRLALADQFRDGNAPASRNIQELVDEAYDSLPAGAWQVQVRSDSADYEQAALDHWDGLGWRFAVSADMSPQLRTAGVYPSARFGANAAWLRLRACRRDAQGEVLRDQGPARFPGKDEQNAESLGRGLQLLSAPPGPRLSNTQGILPPIQPGSSIVSPM